MEPEYDFRGAVRGLVYIPGTWAVRLDRDVAKHYHSAKALIVEGRAPEAIISPAD